LIKAEENSRTFEIDDEDSIPLVLIVDADGFHITQTDYSGYEDQISLSWSHIMGLLEIIDKLEGPTDHVRH
jgi:hypothetical protein